MNPTNRPVMQSSYIGRRFGRLVALCRVASRRFECKCECGNITVVTGANLSSGHTQSCGCLHREHSATLLRTHGKSGTRTHRIWKGMYSRCYVPTEQSYKYYGAVGIGICGRWRNSFADFLSDMGECPPGMSIERRDRLRGYEPDNCVWATSKAQAGNRRDSIRITINGRTQALGHWAEEFGLKGATVRRRYHLGWPIAAALTLGLACRD